MSDELAELTLLRLDPIGVQPYAARGLVQTLTPIAAAGNNRRNINGALLDLSAPQFRKYASNITGNDQAPMPFDNVWPGMTLQVDCIERLSYKVGGSPHRPVVPDSVQRTEAGYVLFYPRLIMKVVNWSGQGAEWAATEGWSLDLEEV